MEKVFIHRGIVVPKEKLPQEPLEIKNSISGDRSPSQIKGGFIIK